MINKKIIKENIFEIILLVLFFLIFVLIGPSNILNHKIQHEHPYNILASDAAGEISYVEGLVQQGNYRYTSPAHCAGFDDCIGFLPFLFQHLSAIFSFTSGLETYNINILFTSIFLFLSCTITFLIIRRWNKQISYLSLPLMLFLFKPQFRIGLMWGWYDVIIASSFVLIGIYFLMDKDLENKWIVLSILIAASFITHIYEMFYLVTIYFTYFIIRTITNKKIEYITLTFFTKTGILTAILIFYYAVIFKLTYASPKLFGAVTKVEWYHALFSHFLILKYVIIAGLIISPFLFKNRGRVPILMGFFFLVFGLNPFHLSLIRAFQVRYLWPIYLAVFFGICVYFILKMIKLNKKIISFSIGLVLLVVISFAYYEPLANVGLIDKDHWNAFEWIKESTDEDAKIVIMYGDMYNQDAITWNSFRTVFRVLESSFIQNMEENKITKFFKGRIPNPSDVGFAYWKSFLNVGRHKEEEDESYFKGEKNICIFDYLLFDKVSRQPVLAQYNLILANKLIESKNFGIAYQNDEVIILENINFNENCIEEGKINE